jgi:hypothetical protein
MTEHLPLQEKYRLLTILIRKTAKTMGMSEADLIDYLTGIIKKMPRKETK